MKRIFVTGANGCIGSATCRLLLSQGVDELVCYGRSGTAPQVGPADQSRVRAVRGDVADAEQVAKAVHAADPTHIIHLAAYQTPDCQAHPLKGMAVNVDGTAHVIRAAARLGNLQRLVLASSAAVYGKRSIYPGPTVTADDPLMPVNLYGYWKLANEGAAQAYQKETGVPTVAVRLATTYGPGRDRGLTSAPTTAMKHAASGRPFRIPYTGREHYHFVDDVGAGFAHACLDPFDGYAAINLRGQTTEVKAFCALIKDAAEQLGLPADLGVADNAEPVTFACDLDDDATLKLFPQMPLTPLQTGVHDSLQWFMQDVNKAP